MVRATRTKDGFRAYYTKSDHILRYMVAMLELQDGMSVFDPCAGDGALIDAVLAAGRNVEITGYELHKSEAEKLSGKYSVPNKVRVRCCDTLLEPTDGIFSDGPKFDRIIANPPYGAWQDPGRRRLLKTLFSGLYVRETYSLFLFKCLDFLKDHGRLVFITPDTYLNLHLHEKLRARILREAAIEEIVVFPSKFFPGLSFGYANLSIITLRRTRQYESLDSNNITVVKGLRNPSDFSSMSARDQQRPAHLEVLRIPQRRVYENSAHAFFVHSDQQIVDSISTSSTVIGDVANVVTGFYSGNDAKYLRRGSETVKGRKRYKEVDAEQIATDLPNATPPLTGMEGPRCFVPIVKGGAKRYIKPDDWFVDWSKEAVLDYRVHNKKKARFQNSAFYFREGLAVPMVTSSCITAALLERRLFDQSIVGVFPKDPGLTNYLLGFFNSEVCNSLIRTVNPSANNSANYIKKIPFRLPNKNQRSRVETLVEKIIRDLRSAGDYDQSDQQQIDEVFRAIYWSSPSE